MIHQCCVAWMVRTWRFNGFVTESEDNLDLLDHQVDLVLGGRLLSLPSLCDALGRLAGLGLLHHCVDDVLHVLAHNSFDGSLLDPVSFL